MSALPPPHIPTLKYYFWYSYQTDRKLQLCKSIRVKGGTDMSFKSEGGGWAKARSQSPQPPPPPRFTLFIYLASIYTRTQIWALLLHPIAEPLLNQLANDIRGAAACKVESNNSVPSAPTPSLYEGGDANIPRL